MDISRLKKVLAGLSATAITLTQVGSVFAAYSDVPAGVWYKDAVDAFVSDGLLDESQPRFRANDNANRAEFVKLLVMMNGGLLSTPPAVPSFDDVKSSAWYYAFMEEAGKEQWVKGDGNCYGSHPCYARPGANINRAEAAALIVRAFALEGTGEAPQFVDNPSGQWYTESIQTAADYCVLQGDDSTGRVRPNDNMNRAEMVVMLHRVDQGLSYTKDCSRGGPVATASITDVEATSSKIVQVEFSVDLDKASAETASHYAVTGASPAVTVVSAKLIADDTVELTLSGNLTAGNDYTVTVTDLESADGDTFSDSADFTGYSALPTSDGTLEVSVSSKNPVGDTVPRGAVGVTMVSMDLTASCDDAVLVEDVTVLHEGFGNQGDISGVYAAVDGGRVSRKRSIDSKDQTATIHFSTPLEVEACKTVTVDLVADFSSTASVSAEHNFAVELPSDVVTNAKQVTGNFPMRGSTFKIAAVTSGNVSISYRTVSPDEVEVGDKGVVIGKFEISTDSVEDQTLYSMTMEQNSSVNDGDITNLKIRRSDGTVLTNTVATTVGDFATFVFDPPFTILEGDKITLEVVADVSGGAGNSIIMHFEETGDIFAVGSLYGYGLNGQLYGSRVTLPTESSTLPDTITVDAGEFTIEINGPSQQSYTRDQNDAVLANIIFTTGGERVDVKKLFIAVQGNTSTGGTLASNNSSNYDAITEVLENVTLRNTLTGRSIDGVLETSGTQTSGITGTYAIYRFDDFTVNGQEQYTLNVDFIDNGSGNAPKGGDQYRIHICGEPKESSNTSNTTGCTFGGLISSSTAYQADIEGLSTGDQVNDVRPRGTISGTAHRVSDASLTVAVKTTAVADTVVRNSKNVNLLRFEARAGEGKDILFTKSIFAAASGSLNNGQNYALWVDSDGDNKVDKILESGVTAQNSKVTFASLTGGGFVLPKEKTVVFEVHSDIVSSTGSNGDDLQIMFSTADSTSYIEAETVDRGSSLSGIKTNGSGTGDITVTTATSENKFIVSQGTLYVTQSDTSLRSRQLLGGTLTDAILGLQFRSEFEDIDVTDLQITSSGATAAGVERLELYKDGATTAFAVATVGGCGSDDTLNRNGGLFVRTFCAKMQSQQLVITKGASNVKVLVRPRMQSDVDGAVSGTGVQLFITKQAVVNYATGSGAVRARGVQSSNNLIANSGDSVANGEIFIGRSSATSTNADIVGNKNFTVLSKIVAITKASDSPADGSLVPLGVNSDIARFKVSAAAHGNSRNDLNKVVLSGVVFNVSATNTSIDTTSFKFYNTEDSSITKTCTSYTTGGTAIVGTASGSFVVVCPQLQASGAPNTKIEQGTDKTFALKANVTNTVNTSSLQVSLQNYDSMSNTVFGAGTTQSHLEWVDLDSASLGTGGTTSSVFRWVESADTAVKGTSFKNS